MSKHPYPIIVVLLGFTLLSACSSPGAISAGVSNSSAPVLTQAIVSNQSSQSIPASLPTETPVPLPNTPEPVKILPPTPGTVAGSSNTVSQATPTCTNRAEFIKDLNVSDNAAIAAGQSFAKLWRIKNAGTCTWTKDYALVFYSGDQMDGQSSVPFSSVIQPGETVDLRVDLVAPFEQTSFTGNWVLKDASGNTFGVGDLGDQAISVTIMVKPTPMPTSG